MTLQHKLLSILTALIFCLNHQISLSAAEAAPTEAVYSLTEKVQFVTAALRLPAVSTASMYKNSKKAQLCSSLVRTLDNGLHIYNHHNNGQNSAYSFAWLVVDALKTIRTLSTSEPALQTAFDDSRQFKLVRLSKTLLIPALETASSLYLAYENGNTPKAQDHRRKAESFLSLCRIANEYLNSQSVTVYEKTVLIACLAHAVLTVYEFLSAKVVIPVAPADQSAPVAPADQPSPEEIPAVQPVPEEIPAVQPVPEEIPAVQPAPEEIPADQPVPVIEPVIARGGKRSGLRPQRKVQYTKVGKKRTAKKR